LITKKGARLFWDIPEQSIGENTHEDTPKKYFWGEYKKPYSNLIFKG
jgi:hypothetical protein